ncbi:MAG: hypothetical protein WAM28_03495 [Chlamydiales bacterium]
MTRVGKKAERRAISPRKNKRPSPKTGPKKDNLPLGYKPLENALSEEGSTYIAKIK